MALCILLVACQGKADHSFKAVRETPLRQTAAWDSYAPSDLPECIPSTNHSTPAPQPGLNLAYQGMTDSTNHPTLDDYWQGRAVFTLDIQDTGLPMGESDTIFMQNGARLTRILIFAP